MISNGSRAGLLFGNLGGFFNLGIMLALIAKIVLMAIASLSTDKEPDYVSYVIYILVMLYFGILGVWIFASAFKMKYPVSMHSGAIMCLVLGIISFNLFAIFGGIFGLVDHNGLKASQASQTSSLQPRFS